MHFQTGDKAEQQAAFTAMVEHLRKQGCVAREPGGVVTCRYRTESGLKCAVGTLIDDEDYSYGLEDLDANELCLRLWDIPKDSKFAHLLDAMQKVHDIYCIESWEGVFVGTADTYGLQLPEATETQETE